MADIRVYQIFYDEATRARLDPGFIPLDNSANERPDWYEFWPIRKFLHQTNLEEGAWYGFLSTRFGAKMSLDASALAQLVGRADTEADVLLLSPGWDQIAYFASVFEQGEFWHPGLINASQALVDRMRLGLDVSRVVTHSSSAAFSNYVVARPAYWRAWLGLAEVLFDVVEAENLGGMRTSYGATASAPMKTFLQERLVSLVLATTALRVVSFVPSAVAPIEPLFATGADTRRLLQACDRLKRQFTATGDDSFRERYWQTRAQIRTSRPVPELVPRDLVSDRRKS